MTNFTINTLGISISQIKDGIFINEKPFLPATIQTITPHYHFTSYSAFRKEYEIKLIETASLFPDKPLVLHYDPEQPSDFFSDLNRHGLKSSFLPKDFTEIWNLLVNSQETGLMTKPLLSSERCGWIIFEGNSYYMTSQFAISKDGLIPEYRCISPYACLNYDKETDPHDAFLETMDLINLDFNEVMPIVITQILSFLQPTVESEKLYSTPGLFLSGSTSTGKTELALALGTLFGNPATKNLQNFVILQSKAKDFDNQQKHFSDTTFVLDDARKSPAYSVRQSITSLIDRLGRSAFIKGATRLTPIVTGEPQVLSGHLASLRNRFIEVYLNPSDEKMASRKSLIGKIKENPLPLRTCLLYFIRFLCGIRPAQLSKEIHRAREEFQASFNKQIYRNDDNLFMHYLGLRLFLSYGRNIDSLNFEDQKAYIDNYIEVLTDIGQNNALYSEDGQINILVRFLCNSIENGNLNIYTPEMQTCYYPDYRRYDDDNEYIEEERSYGYFSVIDTDHGFDGVYIRDRSFLPGYSSSTNPLPTLVINLHHFFDIIALENSKFRDSQGYEAVHLDQNRLKALMADKGLLYTENRYENNYRNYTCDYPHWINYTVCCTKILSINMASPYAKKLIECINSASCRQLPSGCLYSYTDVSPIRWNELNGFNNLKSFKQYQR